MASEHVGIDIGQRIRALREQRELSLRALSEECGLSFNAISRIERGENSPTVSTLHRLATALGVPITSFFRQEAERMTVFVKRRDRLRSEAEGMVMESLGNGVLYQQLEPFYVTVAPGAGNVEAPVTHPGEEFVTCLVGELDYHVDGRVYHLQAGDSLLFKAMQPHGWHNPGQTPATALIVFQAVQDQRSSWTRHLV